MKKKYFLQKKAPKIQSHFAEFGKGSFAEFVIGNDFYVCDAWYKTTTQTKGFASKKSHYSNTATFDDKTEYFVAVCIVTPASRQLIERLKSYEQNFGNGRKDFSEKYKFNCTKKRVDFVFYTRQPFMKTNNFLVFNEL